MATHVLVNLTTNLSVRFVLTTLPLHILPRARMPIWHMHTPGRPDEASSLWIGLALSHRCRRTAYRLA